MKALEFVAKVKQGKLIEIPMELQDKISGEFRVIILMDLKDEQETKSPKEFKALKLKTKNFKFDRDALYEE